MYKNKLHSIKIVSRAFLTLILLAFFSSCNKEGTSPQENQQNACDLHQYTGNWKFIVNGDSSSEYIGQIDKFNDSTLNITYQPDTEYNYFFQTEVNCEDGSIYELLPAGNHGTRTIEGSISLTDFVYYDSTYINYTGQPQITVRTITGTKL